MERLIKRLMLVAFFASMAALAEAQEDVTTLYLQNAGFDEDLTFQADGTMKEAVSTTTSLSDRSWAYIAADSTVYARPKDTSSQSRPDGRKLEAVNGFKGRIQGWEMESNGTFPACEWVYFGSVPYDLSADAVPVADDGSTFLTVPERPTAFDGGVGFIYLRAGWTNRAVYKQVVNLPSAVYRLEYWTINININPSTTSTATDLTQVTCGSDIFKDESGTGFQDQEWTKHEIEFTSTGETTLQFGYQAANVGSGGMPIVALDGITLTMVSESGGEAEPYAVLTDSNTVLTFYYDDMKAMRAGMDIGPFGDYPDRGWNNYSDQITQVVFDPTFADFRPTALNHWFYEMNNLQTINGIEYLRTDSVTTMQGMFYRCYELTNIDVTGFNTENVTNMWGVFEACSSLASIDVTGFNTSNVTTTESMFRDCTSLTTLDLSNFDTGNVTNMYCMFSNSTNLNTIYVNNLWNTDQVTNGYGMFTSCRLLVGGQGTVYDDSHTDYTYARIDGGEAAPGYFTEKSIYTENVTAFSSPSFTVTLNPSRGTAQYFSNYYRLGNGGRLTLQGKSNVGNIVSVKMNLQDPARSGSGVRVSPGTLVGDSIIDVNATTLTITATGSWPQLWISSLDVTYEGTAPQGTYAILLPHYQTNGTVTADMDWADEGDVVTLTATPDEGYHLARLYANQGTVTLSPSAVAADQYTFTMPAETVTIRAQFAEGDITTSLLLNVPEGTEANNAAPIYNLQGQRVKHARRGIYIVGGKKAVN